MKITTQRLAAQLDREVTISRRVLARVPAGRDDWKPHEKSMRLDYLAQLVAVMPSWIAMAIGRDELDIAPKDGPSIQLTPWKTTEELVAQLDDAAAKGRAALAGTSDEFLDTKWKLLARGNVVAENPRHEVIEDTLCHAAHHRGQLSVYLRLLGIPVPSIYGPTADDKVF